MTTIRDSIHQDIKISDVEQEIIDTPEFQRLRRIKQMGFAYFAYPSATHTRFEHCVGTMHLAGRVAKALELNEKDTQELRLAGLLHDVGHTPFSHISPLESMMQKELKKDHVLLGIDIIKMKFSHIIKKYRLDVKNIIDLVQGNGKYGNIISGGIDIDKMDYLVRDSYYTGTTYGLIDPSRLMSTARQ